MEFHTGCHKIDQIGGFEDPWMPVVVGLDLDMSMAALSKDVGYTHAQGGLLGDGRALEPAKRMIPGSQRMPLWATSLGWTKTMAGHDPQQGS